MSEELRVIIPARKSRKGDSTEDDRYARQEYRLTERAERDGHTVITVVRDTISSQSMPWDRPNLKSWFTDKAKLDLWDALYVETDRLSRGDDRAWHYIETFCYENDKRILTVEGVQFPPRDDSDRYQWLAMKRRARTYWEDVRDKHAQTRELIRANGGAIGLPPFGYTITGQRLRKTFVPDPQTAPLAREAFRRIADGQTATSVAQWLSEATGRTWRVKRVVDMIARPTYLGERDGVTFEALVSQEMWDAANAAMASRSFTRTDKGGRRTEHGYSGLIYCACGASLYRHYTGRGNEKYRCSRGRRGLVEEKCLLPSWNRADVDPAVDRLMSRVQVRELVMTTTGGDHARQMELQRLSDAMKDAMARMDMPEVSRLAEAVSGLQGASVEPIRTSYRPGSTYGDQWRDGTLSDRRSLLARGDFHLVIEQERGIVFRWEGDEDGQSKTWDLRSAGKLGIWHRTWDTETI